MADELADRIVRQVLAALGRQGGPTDPMPPPTPPTTPPPVIADDGERASRPATVAPVQPAAGPSGEGERTSRQAPGAPRVNVKKFLTADMVRGRLAGEGGRTLELAADEFLTPAAADLVDALRVAIRRRQGRTAPPGGAAGAGRCAAQAAPGAIAGDPPAPGSAVVRPAAACGRPPVLGLVVERPSDAVQGVLSAIRHDGLAAVDYSQTDCWIANLRLLCQAVADGAVAGGVAILPQAADAMALAGKVRGIRPVQGTRAECVEGALRRFHANLLVLEHAHSTYHEMRSMIRTFAAGPPGPPQGGVLMSAIAELEARP